MTYIVHFEKEEFEYKFPNVILENQVLVFKGFYTKIRGKHIVKSVEHHIYQNETHLYVEKIE